MKQKLIIVASALAALVVSGETMKIKYATIVDIIEDGKVVGSRKLKPGTLVEVVDVQPGDAVKPTAETGAKPAQGVKLRLSKLSPIMFKTTRQSMPQVFNAEIKLYNEYVGQFEGKGREYWSVRVDAYNANWEACETFYGYVRKVSPVGRQVERELADGAERKCRVKLAYVRDTVYDNLAFVESLEVVPGDE